MIRGHAPVAEVSRMQVSGSGATGEARLTNLRSVRGPGAEALRLAALALVEKGEIPQAQRLLMDALRKEPMNVHCLRDMGVLAASQHRWLEAAGYFSRAISLEPSDPRTLANLGLSQAQTGEADQALANLHLACRLQPNEARYRYRLALALSKSGSYPESLTSLTECLELDPDFPPALLLQGTILVERGFPQDALIPLERLGRLDPTNREAQSALAGAYWKCGQLDECLHLLSELQETGATTPDFDSFVVAARLNRFGETRETSRKAVEEWARRNRPPSDTPRVSVRSLSRQPRRLRVGYLTHEFIEGPAIHFLFPLLNHATSHDFETFVYHTNPSEDRYTRAARARADHWVVTSDSRELTRRLGKDRLDILVDPSGHYGRFLNIFHQRHAPVQVAFPDNPSSTGAANMDYILTDSWACPKGFEDQYTETAVRLDQFGYLPYHPPNAPAVSPLPALTNGFITFGLFQRPAKLNPAVWDWVAAILRQAPRSKLFVHHPSPELDCPGSPARSRIEQELEARGVCKHRLCTRGPALFRDHLRLFGEVDIALDTFPYNGQTTTCECLWMGVPVIALCGELHVARVGFEIMARLGLADLLVAHTPEDYVEKAVALASDPVRLAEIRRRLRPLVRASPMADGSVVRGIEKVYQQLWRNR